MQSNKPMAGFGVGPDWETFQRVWKRVMPNEEHSPIQVRTRPAEEPCKPEQIPPKMDLEGELKELMQWLCAGVSRAEEEARQPGALPLCHLLYQQRRQAMRRFGAVFFLQTGKRFSCARASRKGRMERDQMLRQEYLWERQWEEFCRRGAEYADQVELAHLCREQIRQAAQRKEKIRQTLEQME